MNNIEAVIEFDFVDEEVSVNNKYDILCCKMRYHLFQNFKIQ